MGQQLSLAEFEAALRDEEYPLDADTLRSRYGDTSLDLAGGEEAVSTLLERGASSDQYQDAADVLEEVFCAISVAGVGRPGYTDRGGTSGLETRWSF